MGWPGYPGQTGFPRVCCLEYLPDTVKYLSNGSATLGLHQSPEDAGTFSVNSVSDSSAAKQDADVLGRLKYCFIRVPASAQARL